MRILLEGEAACRAAEFAVADLALLRSMCEGMEHELTRDDANSFDEITRLNMEFHRHIHQSSCNKILPALLSGIVQVSVVLHTFRHYTQAELRRSFAQHREIVDAIEAGDPESGPGRHALPPSRSSGIVDTTTPANRKLRRPGRCGVIKHSLGGTALAIKLVDMTDINTHLERLRMARNSKRSGRIHWTTSNMHTGNRSCPGHVGQVWDRHPAPSAPCSTPGSAALPTAGLPVAQLGEQLRFFGTLDDSLREMVTLTVAAHWGAAFEFWAHAKAAKSAGLSDEIIGALREGTKPLLSDQDLLVYSVVRDLLQARGIEDTVYGELNALLGESALVELVMVVGYYSMVCISMRAFAIGLPDDVEPFWPSR